MINTHESLYAEFRKLEKQAKELEAVLVAEDTQFRINVEQACNQLRVRQAEIVESASRDPFPLYKEFIHKCLETTLINS